MIVSITGGTGFIGRRLALRHLAMGDEVRVLSRSCARLPDAVMWHKGDLLENDGFSRFLGDANVLYHCAGQLTDSSVMRRLHVDATRRLAETASGKIGHWVQLSSVGVYGPVSSGLVTEKSPFKPVGEYEETKCESDKIILEAGKSGAFTFSILRPSIVFGGEMKNQSLFAMTKMIEKGIFVFIGKPGASANYIHVENVVEALTLCATMPQARGRIYNLSDYRTMEDFAGSIAMALGKPVPKLRLPKGPVLFLGRILEKLPGFPLTVSRIQALTNRAVYSSEAIQSELGYRHTISMEEGVANLVQAYKKART